MDLDPARRHINGAPIPRSESLDGLTNTRARIFKITAFSDVELSVHFDEKVPEEEEEK